MSLVKDFTFDASEVSLVLSEAMKKRVRLAFFAERESTQADITRIARRAKVEPVDVYAAMLFDKQFQLRWKNNVEKKEAQRIEFCLNILVAQGRTEEQARQMLGIADVEYVPPASKHGGSGDVDEDGE